MNPRIKEILDDLAILSQALHSEQENVESFDILGKIKLLAAQLYLESDMELITSNHIDEEKVVDLPTEDSGDDLPIFSFDIDEQENIDVPAEETVVETPILEQKEENVLHFSQEIPTVNVVETAFEVPEKVDYSDAQIHITRTTIEINPTPTVEVFEEPEISLEEAEHIANEVIEEAVEIEIPPVQEVKQPEIVVPIPEIHLPKAENQNVPSDNLATANAIISKFSLTRRYEFMNFLFGGDMNRFAVFISEILNAPSADAREDVFEKWHEANQWSRKYETATDLKRSLNKILQE